MLSVGERTTVYLDPVSRLEPEGEAELVQRIRTLPGTYPDRVQGETSGKLRLWKVRFTMDRSRIYQRAIREAE